MVICAQAAKKKGKSKSKKAAIVDPLKCGVCVAVAEVVLGEVRKKENDTTTLDLRWGLTAEVKEGKAKRLGKVIPYKRSEVLAVEVMESTCDHMKDFGVYKGVAGESQLVRMSVLGGMKEEDGHQVADRDTVRKNLKATERHCEELVESNSKVCVCRVAVSAMPKSLKKFAA